MFSWVRGKITSGFERVFSYVKDWLFKLIFGDVYDIDSAEKCVKNFFKRSLPWIAAIGAFIGALVCYFCGLISGSTMTKLCINLTHGEMAAESSTNDGATIIAAFVSIMISIAGSRGVEAARYWKVILASVAASAGLSRVLSAVFNLLPFGMSNFIKQFFGSDEDKYISQLGVIINDWTALNALSYNVRVYQTEPYLRALRSLLARMTKLMTTCRGKLPPSLFSLLSRCHSDCNKLHGMLAAGKAINKVRPFPFWLHIYSEPGVGKTVALKSITNAASGSMLDPRSLEIVETADVYERSVKDKFWSRYKCTDHITIIDEFMNVNSSTMLEEQALEMLCLASCGPFTLNMADINPTANGLKGTPFESIAIITCNNAYGLPLSGHVGSGLYRRRNCVVQIRPSFKFGQYFKNGSWRIPKEFEEEQARGEHLEFVFKTGIEGESEIDTLTVVGYEAFTNEVYRRQNEFAKIANRLCGSDYHYEDPEETVAKAMRRFRGVYDPASISSVEDDMKFMAEDDISPTESEVECEVRSEEVRVEEVDSDEVKGAGVPRGDPARKEIPMHITEVFSDEEVISGNKNPFISNPKDWMLATSLLVGGANYSARIKDIIKTASFSGVLQEPLEDDGLDVFEIATDYSDSEKRLIKSNFEMMLSSAVLGNNAVVYLVPRTAGGIISVRPYAKCDFSICRKHGHWECEKCSDRFYMDVDAKILYKAIKSTTVKLLTNNLITCPYSNAAHIITISMLLGAFGYGLNGKLVDHNGVSLVVAGYVKGFIPSIGNALITADSVAPFVTDVVQYGWYDPTCHCFQEFNGSAGDYVSHEVLVKKSMTYDLVNDFLHPATDHQMMDEVKQLKEQVEAKVLPSAAKALEKFIDDGQILTDVDDAVVHPEKYESVSKNDMDELRKTLEASLDFIKHIKGGSLSDLPAMTDEEIKEVTDRVGDVNIYHGSSLTVGGFLSGITVGLAVPLLMKGFFSVCSYIYSYFNEGKAIDLDPAYCETYYDQDYDNAYKLPSREKPRGKFHKKCSRDMEAEAKKITWVEFQFGDGSIRAIPIKENWFLTMRHGLRRIKSSLECVLIGNEVSYTGELVYESIVESDVYDCALFQFNCKTMPSYPNVVNLFASQAELTRFERAASPWWCTTDFGDGNVTSSLNYKPRVSYIIDGVPTFFERCAIYLSATRPGYCGTPIFVRGPNNHLVCIGYHVAGNADKSRQPKAYCQLICKEDIIAMLECAEEMREESLVGDNLEYVGNVQYRNQVHVPDGDTFTPSPLQELDVLEVLKAPAIVSADDPRARGIDPVLKGLDNLAQWDGYDVEVDSEKFEAIVEDCRDYFSSRMKFEGYDRTFTLEEAVGGIPGVLNSMNLNTSLGYPLCKTYPQGKSALIKLVPNGAPEIDPVFRERCLFVEHCLKTSFDDKEFRMLAYPKNELLKLKKIEEVNTRVTYCSDSCLTAVARMLFGCLLIGFENSSPATCANGLNQYSYDFQKVVDHLSETLDKDHSGYNFVAGDLKKMDQHYLLKFQEAAYDILYSCLPKPMQTERMRYIWNNFVETQIHPMVQYKDKVYKFKCAHFSGCVFTTIINNIVNQLYMRYMFSLLNTGYTFDSCVRMVQQGDDHVLCINRNICEDFNQLYLEDKMSILNQVYTSDDKDVVSEVPFRPIEEISFLGAHPFQLNGVWCGRLRKFTIENTPLWLRKDDLGLWRDCLEAMLNYASMWEKDYFSQLKEWFNLALAETDQRKLKVSYGVRLAVAQRTASFKLSDDVFLAESYTTFNTDGIVQQEYINLTMPREGGGIGGGDDDLSEGCDSFLFKTSIEWTKSKSAGEYLLAPQNLFPQQLIGLDGGNDPQAVKFRSFTYYRSDFEIRIQTNGNRTQQGALILYVLYQIPSDYRNKFQDSYSIPHAVILPNNTEDIVLEVPFRSPYPFLPTNAGFCGIFLQCLSPLEYTSGSSVTVNLYVRMKNYEFKVARPLADTMLPESEAPSEPAPQAAPDKPKSNVEGGEAAKLVMPTAANTNINAKVSKKRRKTTTVQMERPTQKGKGKKNGKNTKQPNNKNNKTFGRRKRSDKKETKKKVAVQQGGKGSKKGGRKFTNAKNKSKSRELSEDERTKRSQQSWDAYFKKFGAPPAVADGQMPYASKAGWAVVEVQSGKIVNPPKNFCFSLLQDMVVGLTSDILEEDELSDIELLTDMGLIAAALGFFDDPLQYKLPDPMNLQAGPMSVSNGGYYAKAMQLHPLANYKPGRLAMDPAEMNLDFLFAREGKVADFSWSIEDSQNTVKLAIPLDSTLGITSDNMTVALCALNQFQFFHCVFHFRIYIFKTFFHTGRLRVIKAYGVDSHNSNLKYTMDTEILDFDADTIYCDFEVPWVAMTDYLRTRDGPRALLPTRMGERDFSLGYLFIEVANMLCVANETVPISVKAQMTCRLTDVRVAVPKFTPLIAPVVDYETPALEMYAEDGLDDESVEEIDAPDFDEDDLYPDDDEVKEAKPGFGPGHSNLDLGAAFEFVPGNILDVCRRFCEIPYKAISSTSFTSAASSVIVPEPPAGYWILDIPVRPTLHTLSGFYRGFSGSVVIRVYSASTPCVAYYVPTFGGDTAIVTPVGLGDPGVSKRDIVRYGNSTTKATIQFSQVRGSIPNPPMEIFLSGTSNAGYFDLALPYQQHVMYLTPFETPDFIIGHLYVYIYSTALRTTRVYQKIGDDGSFGIFCPPKAYQDAFVIDSSVSNVTRKAFAQANGGLNGYYF